MKKTLFEMQKGKQMHASGSWGTTQGERMIINILAIAFAACCLIAVFLPIFSGMRYPQLSILFFVLTFVFAFAMGGYLFYLVYKKNKEKPMEEHYYSVDYKYNGITDKTEDRTQEISKDEFFNKNGRV